MRKSRAQVINLKANAELTVLSGSLSEIQSTCVDTRLDLLLLGLQAVIFR